MVFKDMDQTREVANYLDPAPKQVPQMMFMIRSKLSNRGKKNAASLSLCLQDPGHLKH